MSIGKGCNEPAVFWQGLNKVYSGTIVGEHPKGLLIQLENGKYVVVHPDSIREFISNL